MEATVAVGSTKKHEMAQYGRWDRRNRSGGGCGGGEGGGGSGGRLGGRREARDCDGRTLRRCRSWGQSQSCGRHRGWLRRRRRRWRRLWLVLHVIVVHAIVVRLALNFQRWRVGLVQGGRARAARARAARPRAPFADGARGTRARTALPRATFSARGARARARLAGGPARFHRAPLLLHASTQ